MVAAGAVPALVSLLSHQQPSKQEAGLGALAALTTGNSSGVAACLAHEGVLSTLLSFLKHSAPHARFLACVCLTNLCQQLPAAGASTSSSRDGRSKQVELPLCAAVQLRPNTLVAAYGSLVHCRLHNASTHPAPPPRCRRRWSRRSCRCWCGCWGSAAGSGRTCPACCASWLWTRRSCSALPLTRMPSPSSRRSCGTAPARCGARYALLPPPA